MMMADAVVDAVSLCITCKWLLDVGHSTCNTRISKKAAKWAGSRIVIMGWHRVPVLPHAESGSASLESSGDHSEDLVNFVRLHGCLRDMKVDENGWALDEDMRSKLSPMDILLFDRFSSSIDNPKSPWVLCNLSKRQFVCGEDMIKNSWVKLGAILASQIFWAPDPRSVKLWGGAPRKGQWVGDRFEITTLDRLNGGPEGWTDVRDELLLEFEAIRNATAL